MRAVVAVLCVQRRGSVTGLCHVSSLAWRTGARYRHACHCGLECRTYLVPPARRRVRVVQQGYGVGAGSPARTVGAVHQGSISGQPSLRRAQATARGMDTCTYQ